MTPLPLTLGGWQIIDAAYPNTRKIELFARTETPGWAAWGNQTGLFP